MIEAILFDLDGTLVDREVGAKNWLFDQFRAFVPQQSQFGSFYADFQQLDARGHASKLETFGALGRKWGWPLAPEEIWSHYRQNVWRFCELYPDALPTLSQLRQMGLKLAIVTNGTIECQESKINQLGLAPLVDASFISEREGIKKPAPEMFLRACTKLNTPAASCLMVGDSLDADVNGALDAELQAVFLNRNSVQTLHITHTMHSLSELIPLMNGASVRLVQK